MYKQELVFFSTTQIPPSSPPSVIDCHIVFVTGTTFVLDLLLDKVYLSVYDYSQICQGTIILTKRTHQRKF